ncbi:hypothetical protein STEG23_032912, partial [Scotinomys teguina]
MRKRKKKKKGGEGEEKEKKEKKRRVIDNIWRQLGSSQLDVEVLRQTGHSPAVESFVPAICCFSYILIQKVP